MTVPAHIVAGREGELALIDHSVEAASGGTFAWVALTGEPGIGKTLLLREVCRRAEARGFKVVEGRGTEFEDDVPFGLAVDALAELGSISALGIGPDGIQTTLPAERYRFHHAVRAAIETVAAEQPLVIALDDVHCADDASLELIAHLLRHAPAGAVLLALAYRGATAPSRLSGALAAAERDGTGTSIVLGPLGYDAAAHLLPASAGESECRALYTDSGGNPFYLTELARSPRPAGDDVPGAVQAAIEQEVEQIPPGVRDLLRAAAAVGDPFPLGLAARVAEVNEHDALAALDAIAPLGLVRPAAEPGTWTFRHPVVRRAAYMSAGPRLRLEAHARAAVELERAGAPLSARAHHVERAAEVGDTAAVDLLAGAGAEVFSRAPATAARWLGAAVRLLPPETPADQRLALLVPLAEALGASGQLCEGRRVLTDALDLLPADLVVLRARVIGAIARLDHTAGRHGETRRLLTDALAATPADRPLDAVSLRIELLMESWLGASWHELAADGATAADMAEELGDPLLTATAQALYSLGLYYTGATAPGKAAMARAADLVDSLPDDEVAGRIEVLAALGSAEFGLERYDDSVRHLERAIAICRATGQGSWFILMQCLLGAATIALGRLDDAAAATDAACESARLTHDQPLIWALSLRAWVKTLQGDLDGARRAGEETVTIAATLPPTIFNWLAHGMLAMAEVESGRPGAARDRVLAHAGGPELTEIEPSWRPRWYELLCHAELRLGNSDAARAWADLALEAATPLELDSRMGEALGAQAAVALASGDASRAAGHAREAARRFAAIGRRIEAARASELEAQALAAGAHAADADALLSRAHAELEACGVTGHRDEPPALSDRELQVARLAGDGLKNREIAAELFVSHKTVEKDLARVFRKLGISSRAGVAGALLRDEARERHA